MSFRNFLRSPVKWLIFRVDNRLLMIATAAVVGLCAGFAALLLNWSIEEMTELLTPFRQHRWGIFLPAIGAALSSLFLRKIMREEAGHGIPEVIGSVSGHGGFLKFRSSFSRLISSCLTIGSGGSVGPEAPVVMSGSAIGSNIAKFLCMNDRQRITLVGCGAAAAIAAIFNAPVAGMVFTIEVILGEWTAANIIPIAISAVVGTEISRWFNGNQIVFANPGFHISVGDIPACIGLAVLTAAVSILLAQTLKLMHHVVVKLSRVPIFLRAALGGLAVGCIALYFPVVSGEGYRVIRTMIEGNYRPGLIIPPLAVLAKVLATSFSLGWGGSGGIFAPCLAIGSLTGVGWHRLLMLVWPSAALAPEGGFALLGMAGLIAGILQAPLTAIFLIVDITGGYDMILPLIIVSTFSTAVCRYIDPVSFYFKDLVAKGHLLRPGTDERVLSDLRILELIEKDCIPVKQNMSLRELVHVVQKSQRNYFPVEDEETGHFLGLIHLDDIRPYLFDQGMYDVVLSGQIMKTDIKTLDPGESLSDVLNYLDAHHLYSLPVVANNRFVGMISKATLLDQYRKELMVQACE